MLGGALVAWFVLAIWSFASGGLVDYLLFIVSAFLFVTVALSLILSRAPTRRRRTIGSLRYANGRRGGTKLGPASSAAWRQQCRLFCRLQPRPSA
jgi:hypothetical protein